MHCRRVAVRFSGLLLGALLLASAVHAADPAGSGPERAIVYSDPSLPSHTIYRPADLEGGYPVVLWGNGSCVNSSFGYREFLSEIASHGFIVLAIGPYRDSPAPRQPRAADPAGWPPFETSYKQMLEGLDWITAENRRAGSAFSGKVAVDKVAAMGHSCGGLQTVKVSTDPRITTAVVLNSGMITDEDQYMVRHELKRSVLDQMHAPIAYFIGGETDIAYANGMDDYARIDHVPAMMVNLPVGHGGTYHEPNGGKAAAIVVDWLEWRLRGDSESRAAFACPEGRWCRDSQVSIERKNGG